MKYATCPLCRKPRMVITRGTTSTGFVYRLRRHKSMWPVQDHFAERVVHNPVCPASGRRVTEDFISLR